jgi:hypothetical protein
MEEYWKLISLNSRPIKELHDYGYFVCKYDFIFK